MGRTPGEQFERVWKDVNDCFERLDRSLRRSRDIEHEALTDRARDAARKAS